MGILYIRSTLTYVHERLAYSDIRSNIAIYTGSTDVPSTDVLKQQQVDHRTDRQTDTQLRTCVSREDELTYFRAIIIITLDNALASLFFFAVCS